MAKYVWVQADEKAGIMANIITEEQRQRHYRDWPVFTKRQLDENCDTTERNILIKLDDENAEGWHLVLSHLQITNDKDLQLVGTVVKSKFCAVFRDINKAKEWIKSEELIEGPENYQTLFEIESFEFFEDLSRRLEGNPDEINFD